MKVRLSPTYSPVTAAPSAGGAPTAAQLTAATAAFRRLRLMDSGAGRLKRSAVGFMRRADTPFRVKVPDLLARRYALMAASPFAFFRGTDALFDADLRALEGAELARQPSALLSGDLHMANLGTVLRADGSVFLGLNDWDEATAGPVTVDLKRFATSILLAAHQNGLTGPQGKDLVRSFARAYVSSLDRLASGRALNVHVPPAVAAALDRAHGADVGKWLDGVTPMTPDGRRFGRTPTATSVPADQEHELRRAFEAYRRQLPPDVRQELAGYQVADAISAVAGTGSVGNGRYRLLLTGPGDPVIVEVKEEGPASLAAHVSAPAFRTPAERVLGLANLLDGPLDRFMGTATLPRGMGVQSRSFLVRRLTPTKTQVDPASLKSVAAFRQTLVYDAAVIATAHASGASIGLADARTIRAALPSKGKLADDLATFAGHYADQVHRDFQEFKKAWKTGALMAPTPGPATGQAADGGAAAG